MSLLQCAFCKQDIDDDSSYCDQCGKQLMMCPQGNHLCETSFCAKHGKKVVPYVQGAVSSLSTTGVTNTVPAPPQAVTGTVPVVTSPPAAAGPVATNPIATPAAPRTCGALRLHSAGQGIDVRPQSGDVIGRRNGQHVATFSRFGQISGSHLQLRQDDQKQWWVKDLNSSNGTYLNKSRLKADAEFLLQDGAALTLGDISVSVEIQ